MPIFGWVRMHTDCHRLTAQNAQHFIALRISMAIVLLMTLSKCGGIDKQQQNKTPHPMTHRVHNSDNSLRMCIFIGRFILSPARRFVPSIEANAASSRAICRRLYDHNSYFMNKNKFQRRWIEETRSCERRAAREYAARVNLLTNSGVVWVHICALLCVE